MGKTAKEQRAAIRPWTYLLLLPLVSVWIFTGSFMLGIAAALAVPLVLFALVVAFERLR